MDENTESLIEEIEKRPPIYNKSLWEYANINIKKQLWEEVCAAVIPNWSGLEGENKTRAGKLLKHYHESLEKITLSYILFI